MVFTTEVISDPPASRSDTRTVDWAQEPACNPACRPTATSLPENPMPDKPIVGVDVAKDWLDINIAGETAVKRIPNDPQAITAWLERIHPALVGFEPTGGYERDLREALRQCGIPFRRIHPNTLIDYRRGRGIRAKTDAIDARLIADYAAEQLGGIVGDEAG